MFLVRVFKYSSVRILTSLTDGHDIACVCWKCH